MAYLLGVDLGTTFTAAAVASGGEPAMVGLGNRALQIPSVLFYTGDGFVVGEAAERRGLVEPGRVVREFKRRLGDRVPVLVGGSPFSADALMAELLSWVVAQVSAQTGGPPDGVVLTHPASWGPFKLEALHQVAVLADVGVTPWCAEPAAAAAQYASRARLDVGERIAVYDLGGGTFDVCVLEKTATGFAMLGPPEGVEQLGGVDFNEALFQLVLRGLGDRLAEADPDDPQTTDGLARLRRDCVEAKEALSTEVEVGIPVTLPGLGTSVRVLRTEFEGLIRPTLQQTVRATARAVRSAGLSHDQLSAIVLVGGSSRIPLVGEMLQREFGVPTAIDTHPKHDIALGAVRLTQAAGPPPAAAGGTIPRPIPMPIGRPQPAVPAAPAASPVVPAPAPTSAASPATLPTPVTPVTPVVPLTPVKPTPVAQTAVASTPVASAPEASTPAATPPVTPTPVTPTPVTPTPVTPTPVTPTPVRPAAGAAAPPVPPRSAPAAAVPAAAVPAASEQSLPTNPRPGPPAAVPPPRPPEPVQDRRRPSPKLLVAAGLSVVAIAAGIGVGLAVANPDRETLPPLGPAVSTSVATPSPSPSPTPTPTSTLAPLPTAAPLTPTQLVVPMKLDDNWDLYLADTDKPGPGDRLTTSKRWDTFPSLSPDRSTVIYVRKPADDDDPPTLRVVAVDGTGDRELFDPPKECAKSISRPAWNPVDPSLLAAPCVDKSGRMGLFELNTDGQVIRQIDLGDNKSVGDPAFSPNGQTLVFWAAADDDVDAGTLMTAPTDGSAPAQQLVASTMSEQDADPVFSPNGDSVAFRRRGGTADDRKDLDIWRVDLASRTTPGRLTSPGASDQDPAWSPNGDQIAYKSARKDDDAPDKAPQHIWVMDSDGANQRLLWTKGDTGEQTASAWNRR